MRAGVTYESTAAEPHLYPWLVDPLPPGEEPEPACECGRLATVVYLSEPYCSTHARIWVDRAPTYIARAKGLMA